MFTIEDIDLLLPMSNVQVKQQVVNVFTVQTQFRQLVVNVDFSYVLVGINIFVSLTLFSGVLRMNIFRQLIQIYCLGVQTLLFWVLTLVFNLFDIVLASLTIVKYKFDLCEKAETLLFSLASDLSTYIIQYKIYRSYCQE